MKFQILLLAHYFPHCMFFWVNILSVDSVMDGVIKTLQRTQGEDGVGNLYDDVYLTDYCSCRKQSIPQK